MSANTNTPSHPICTLSRFEHDTDLLERGFLNLGLMGFIFQTQNKGMKLLKRVAIENYDDYLFTTMIEEEVIDKRRPVVSDFGFVHTSNNGEFVQLHRYFNKEERHHLFLTYPKESLIAERGYRDESVKNQIYISPEPIPGTEPVYLYSTSEKIKDLFEIPVNSYVDLHSDSLTPVDKLGRKPFVEAMVKYIKRLWGKIDNSAYTIHLNGEWGSGKSNLLYLLRERLLEKKKDGKHEKDWIISDFNAWQNQHLEDPWWVFLNSVHRDIIKSSGFGRKLYVYFSEFLWRTWILNKPKWLTVISLILISLLFGIVSLFFDEPPELVLSEKFRLDIDNLIYIPSLLSSIILVIYNTFNSLFPGNQEAANKFRSRIGDPMKRIKEHYDTIIKRTGANVAVFIDDIDRCNPEFVVKILEGIQTLFSSTKVLYVVSGDANWIRESFKNHYGNLNGVISKKGQNLGNFFLEKIFQISISLPQISDEIKRSYWSALLNGDDSSKDSSNYSKSLKKMQLADGDTQIDQIISEAESDDEKIALRISAVDKIISEKGLMNIEHAFYKYHELIEPNARSMKRLVNNLALEKVAVYLSGLNEKINEDLMIRWAILRSRFPDVALEIKKDPNKYLPEYKDIGVHREISSILEGVKIEHIVFLNC